MVYLEKWFIFWFILVSFWFIFGVFLVYSWFVFEINHFHLKVSGTGFNFVDGDNERKRLRERESNESEISKVYLGDSNRQPQSSRENLLMIPLNQSKKQTKPNQSVQVKRLGWR